MRETAVRAAGPPGNETESAPRARPPRCPPGGGGGASGKLTLAVSASVAPGAALQIANLATKRGAVAVAEQKERIDVFVNGQLLLSGSSGSEDYFLSIVKDSEVHFNFAVVEDDVVSVIIR